jgi:low affinity Fe/Cu permease
MVIEDTAAAGSESRIDHLLSRVSILFVSAVWIPATVCAIFLFGGGTSWATPAAFTAVAVFLLLCFVLFRGLRAKGTDPYRCIDPSALISFRGRLHFHKGHVI